MKKEQNNEPAVCCESGCDCGAGVDRKTPKIVICLVVLLAVVSILAYKVIAANNNAGKASTVKCCPGSSDCGQ